MMSWDREFIIRLEKFAEEVPGPPGAVPVSIKVRVTGGCFHREHSPIAYEMIDKAVDSVGPDARSLRLVPHENGLEIISWVEHVVELMGSVILLVTAILHARAEGIRRGDRPAEPVELVVRKEASYGGVRELTLARLSRNDPVVKKDIERLVKEGLANIAQPTANPEVGRPEGQSSGPASGQRPE